MENNIEKEMLEAIKKNLPQQVGEVLKAELERLKAVEKEHADLQNSHKIILDDFWEKEKKIGELVSEIGALKTKEEGLRIKEDELWKKEKELEIREIRVINEITKKECAEKGVADLKEVFGIVFKNPVVQRSVVETNNGQWCWDSVNNRNAFYPDGNGSKTETETTN
jgi:hypothetical protein